MKTAAGLDFGAEQATAPVPAATLLVLREGTGAGLEVFCVRRHAGIAFMGGAVVFPGGKVDPSDRSFSGELSSEPNPRGRQMTDAPELPEGAAELRALSIAACREALEEAAILPARLTGGAALDAETTLRMRDELEAGSSFEAILSARGATLDLAALVPFARWVTPLAERRRFDARFFLLPLPPGQEGRHDDRETTAGFWDTPQGVLTRFAKGEIQLAPPTTRSLEVLTEVATVAAAIEAAGSQTLRPICPRFVPEDPPVLALPGDPAHPERDVRVIGPTRFVLRDGRFVSEDAP